MLVEKERWKEEQEQKREKGESDPVEETLAMLVEYRSEPVIMLDAEIKGQKVEAMFDPGATMDFIDERIVRRLGLKKERTTPNRITVANGGVETIEWVVNASVQFKKRT
jgi:predicted aspartyl protease